MGAAAIGLQRPDDRRGGAALLAHHPARDVCAWQVAELPQLVGARPRQRHPAEAETNGWRRIHLPSASQTAVVSIDRSPGMITQPIEPCPQAYARFRALDLCASDDALTARLACHRRSTSRSSRRPPPSRLASSSPSRRRRPAPRPAAAAPRSARAARRASRNPLHTNPILARCERPCHARCMSSS